MTTRVAKMIANGVIVAGAGGMGGIYGANPFPEVSPTLLVFIVVFWILFLGLPAMFKGSFTVPSAAGTLQRRRVAVRSFILGALVGGFHALVYGITGGWSGSPATVIVGGIIGAIIGVISLTWVNPE